MPQGPTTSTQGILGPSVRAFELIRFSPASDLSEFVERHWVVRWHLKPGTSFTQELLPHPCVNLVCEPGRVAVHGTPLTRSQHRLVGDGLVVGTKFRPGAFSSFLDLPATELLGGSFELGALFGNDGAELTHEMWARGHDVGAQIDAIEAFLRRRLPPPDPRRQRLFSVVSDMLDAHASLTVADLARRHGMSVRTLQRLFRDFVGLGPKWVLKRYRVHEAAERIAAGEAPDAARLAAELGYFDQPHFVNDFTLQVGCSPSHYAQLCAGAAIAEGIGAADAAAA